MAAGHAPWPSRVAGDNPFLGHADSPVGCRVVAVEDEPGLPAGADCSVVGGLGSLIPTLIKVDRVHETSVDYGECRPQGETVNDL